jgi:hypothetical protein
MACELRFQGKARMTRDLDAVFHGSLSELFADLDAAFAEPYSGFTFRYPNPRQFATPVRTGSTSGSSTKGGPGGHYR